MFLASIFITEGFDYLNTWMFDVTQTYTSITEAIDTKSCPHTFWCENSETEPSKTSKLYQYRGLG